MKQQMLDALFSDGGLLRVRSGLAFIFSGTTCFLWVTGEAVPDALLAVNAIVVGFYFGSRTSESSTAAAAVVEADKVAALEGP